MEDCPEPNLDEPEKKYFCHCVAFFSFLKDPGWPEGEYGYPDDSAGCGPGSHIPWLTKIFSPPPQRNAISKVSLCTISRLTRICCTAKKYSTLSTPLLPPTPDSPQAPDHSSRYRPHPSPGAFSSAPVYPPSIQTPAWMRHVPPKLLPL